MEPTSIIVCKNNKMNALTQSDKIRIPEIRKKNAKNIENKVAKATIVDLYDNNIDNSTSFSPKIYLQSDPNLQLSYPRKLETSYSDSEGNVNEIFQDLHPEYFDLTKLSKLHLPSSQNYPIPPSIHSVKNKIDCCDTDEEMQIFILIYPMMKNLIQPVSQSTRKNPLLLFKNLSLKRFALKQPFILRTKTPSQLRFI